MLVNTKYEPPLEGQVFQVDVPDQGRLQSSHQITLPSVDYY
jgi:hypothetical protein